MQLTRIRGVVTVALMGLVGCSDMLGERPGEKHSDEALGSTSEALKGAATPPNFSLSGPSFENVAGVASPHANCPNGQMMLSLGGPGTINRPLYAANGQVDTTPNLPSVPHQVSLQSSGYNDNNIVHLNDGTFLANVHGSTWRPLTAPPTWLDDEVIGEVGPQVGNRWALHFVRSDTCGSNWQISTMMDMADVSGGIYAKPRPAKRGANGLFAGIDVACADQTTTNDELDWWIGGGDRPELYACPFTGNVYLSFWGVSGPYCPDQNDTQFAFGMLMVSRDKGASWELVTELPPTPPFVMTSTPDGRLFLFAIASGQPTLFVSTPTAAGQLPQFLTPPTPCGGVPGRPRACGFPANELDSTGTPIPYLNGGPVDAYNMEWHPSISRISTDRSSSKVRLMYHDRDPASGMQRARVVRAEVPPEGGAPLIKPLALVSAQDPQDHSALYFNFNDPDYVTIPSGTRSNTSMAYWVEAPRCRPGEISSGRVCRDPQADSTACGATACAAGQLCSLGQCVAACPAGRTQCTAINSSGQGCFDLTTSTRNCGACGNTCNFGQTCSAGVCVAGSGKPGYNARHMFFEGDCRATTPEYISVTPNGADRTWEGTNLFIGDYMKGASWWHNGQLNFLAHWSEPTQLSGATTVSPFGASQPDLHVWTADRLLSDFQAWDNNVRADGWQSADIDSHVLAAGDIRVNGVWHHQPTPTGWIQGHTVADFQTAFANFTSSGFRLEKLSSFVLNDGGVRVDALWEQNANPSSGWIQGYTVADFITENTVRTSAGARLEHLSSWKLADGGIRVDAVWHDAPGGWAFVQGYTVADFMTEDSARRSSGWRLDTLASFVLDDGSVRVDAVWHTGPEQSLWRQGYTIEDFRSEEADLRCDGWQLQKVSAFAHPDGVRVDGVWHRPQALAPTALCQDVTVTSGASCTGTITADMVDNGSFTPSGAPPTLTLSSTGPFPIGTTQVTLTVSDGVQSSQCTANVTVADGIPPVITPPAGVSTTQCLSSASVTVGAATATDVCGTPVISGAVVSSNGVAVVPPIPVSGTQVTLGIGTHVIEWTASDGTNKVTTTQVVTVGPRIEASQSFLVRDRAHVTTPNGTLAAVSNGGGGLTQVGYDGQTGGIFSVGPVKVLDRAVIGGNILSASTVEVSEAATHNFTSTQFASVVLPALPTLPAFPAATGGSLTIDSGSHSRGPGSYNTFILNGGTLNLTSAGDYFFRSLTINSAATIRVAANVRIFVQNQLAYRSPFRVPVGSAVQTVYLGFAGTNLTMEALFNGTLLAPSGFVSFGVGPGLTFNGSFFASTIEVRPDSRLVCL